MGALAGIALLALFLPFFPPIVTIIFFAGGILLAIYVHNDYKKFEQSEKEFVEKAVQHHKEYLETRFKK